MKKVLIAAVAALAMTGTAHAIGDREQGALMGIAATLLWQKLDQNNNPTGQVYVQPQPVYVQPRTVYVQPAPCMPGYYPVTDRIWVQDTYGRYVQIDRVIGCR
jgi:hypothetical protein